MTMRYVSTRGNAPPATLALAPPEDGGPRRQLVLWAVLLGATALLGGMAWLLWRRAATGSEG